MARKREIKGMLKRSRRHVQDDDEARGHRAVPARAGRPAAARPRRHRAQGRELHGLHALRPSVPRLVHLHRGPQGAARRRAARAASRARVSVLDRFDIDYALCMYCGICVEVCPFDALFWSPEYEYSEPRIADLLHDKDRLGEWMETVPEPEPLEVGRRGEGQEVASMRRAEHRLRDHRGGDGDRRDRRRARRRTSCTPRCTSSSCSPAAPRSSSCSAEFVAVVQVLVYIGAVDRAVPVRHHAHPRADASASESLDNDLRWPARSSSRCSSLGVLGGAADRRVPRRQDRPSTAPIRTAAGHATRSSAPTSSRSRSSACCCSPRSIGAVVLARKD